MNGTKKRYAMAGLAAACALTLSAGLFLMKNDVAVAQTTNIAENYFYETLQKENGEEYTLAKKFYEALEEMNKNGDFKDGVVDYRIDSIVSSDQLKGWVENGNLEVPKAFSAARDAFLTDHPEIFYINFYKLTISVGKSGGNYVGYINSGREANLYYENGFNTPEAVAEAVANYERKVAQIVADMNEKEQADTLSERDVFLAKEVNRYLAENIEYDTVAYENKDDPNYIAAAYVNTPYGGIVEGKAVCGGFSTAYKVIMDELGVPCITVNGYTNNKDSNGKNAASNVYHMWNYVYLKNSTEEGARTFSAKSAEDARWYSVDVTWNSAAGNKNRYAVLNASVDAEHHVNDGVISSSGYRLVYPTLSAFNYGSTGETDGLQYSIVYNRDGNLKDDNDEPLMCNFKTVSYNGKSALSLIEEDHLYIAYRDARYANGSFSDELEWTRWTALGTFIDFMTGGIYDQDFYIQDNGTETRFYDNTSVYATQFAVFDVEPDGIKFGETIVKYFYSDDFVNTLTAVETGELLINQTYGTYTPPPYIQQSGQSTVVISDSMRDPTITDKVMMAESKAIVFEIQYDEPLHKLDPEKPIGITFSSAHPNTKDYDRFFPVNDNGDLVELVEGPVNSGDSTKIMNTLRFKFAPSLLYEHNEEGYHFAFSNVGSAKIVRRKVGDKFETVTSDKAPNPAFYNFGRVVVACPACFNYDGRLWIECCAQPTLVTNSDLSEMDFKDEDGNSTFTENERSQMMLVAERANNETIDTMLNEITDHDDINVTADDVISSETYDIRLQMCSKYPTIPDGSYVKIALGFPEGYGPQDEGVTFKLFHRKHDPKTDTYSIEEVPCVVTKFGIVATVTSFSPYMVAVVDADKATDKTVYASIEGKGGRLTMEDGKIQTVEEGKSYTYTIQPDEGYRIHSVKLNGAEVKDRVQSGGSLTLTYEELKTNNELVIQYISAEAANRIQAKLDSNVIDEAIEVTKYVVAVKDQPVYSNAPLPRVDGNADNGNENVIAAIVIVSVTCVLAAAAVVTCILVARKKKKQS